MIAIGLGGNLGTDAEIIERFRFARSVLRAPATPRRPKKILFGCASWASH